MPSIRILVAFSIVVVVAIATSRATAGEGDADPTATARLTTRAGNQVVVTIRGLPPEGIALYDPAMREYLRVRDKAQREVATLRRIYGERHPSMQDKVEEIRQYTEEIRALHAAYVMADPQLREVMRMVQQGDWKLEIVPFESTATAPTTTAPDATTADKPTE